MSVEKLPSGHYRIKKQIDGKKYSITIDHRPSKFEIEEILNKLTGNGKSSLQSACETYIKSKQNILSPSTIREYNRKVKNISNTLLIKSLADITPLDLQTEINDYAATHSSKSTHDFSGFIMSVLNFYDIMIKRPKLPQIERKIPYIPTEEEMQLIYKEIAGTEFEIAIILASMGLRRSEICALTLADLDGNTLTINKALVQDENKQWVIKSTKTTDSTRTIKIPPELADKIREKGYIYNGFPGAIYNYLTKIEKKLGIKHFSLHKLRHFFASYMHNLGYSDKQIQEFGGWKTDNVMKTVYQHSMEMEQTKTEIAGTFGNLIKGKKDE